MIRPWNCVIFTLCFICLTSLIGAYDDDDSSEPVARLLVYKSSLTNPVVEGQNFQILYQVINNGDGIARKVEIDDRYDLSSFEEVPPPNEAPTLDSMGAFSLYYDEIQPGDKVAFNITVQPKLSGLYDSTRARIKYASGIGYDDDIRKGFSTSLGRVKIMSIAEYERKSSYFVKEWIVFIVLYSIVSLLPMHAWMNASKKNNLITAKKKIG